MDIYEDDVTGEKIINLLKEHLENMHEITPPESVHALDLGGLRVPEITFWTAWEGENLLGCGALKELNGASGEIKSMRTATAHRGKGFGAAMLEHILKAAKERGYTQLYLETGAMPEFVPARRLYARYGFEERGPFGNYTDDPNSVFMSKQL